MPDPELDGLRQNLTASVAQRMQNELDATGSVLWARGVLITREGLEYHTGRKGVTTLPFGEIARCDAANGGFFVRRPARARQCFRWT